MTVEPAVLVLPAFDDLAALPSEATPWNRAYDLDETVHVTGISASLRYAESGLAVAPTGVGKTAAATTTTALLASDRIDLSETLVLSVGVAGGPPELSIGSVVIADDIVDWDDKCRLDNAGSDETALALNPYTEGQGVFDLDPSLVEWALSLGETATLEGTTDDPAADENPAGPAVVTGTNVCGDELWHGKAVAEQVAWLLEEYETGPYRATEMEDSGTATALRRFGKLDQYLSIRGISNYDRPDPGVSARESFFDPAFESGFETGIRNAVSVAQTVVDEKIA